MKNFEGIKFEMEIMEKEEFRKMAADKYKTRRNADIDRVALHLTIVC